MAAMDNFEKEGIQMKTRIHLAAPLIALSLAAAGAAFAQTTDRLGKVEFPNSCSLAVQEKLLRGIAMLHSFYYSRSEEHTSELQSQSNLVCRLLLEKKKKNNTHSIHNQRDPHALSPGLIDPASDRRAADTSDVHASPLALHVLPLLLHTTLREDTTS